MDEEQFGLSFIESKRRRMDEPNPIGPLNIAEMKDENMTESQDIAKLSPKNLIFAGAAGQAR